MAKKLDEVNMKNAFPEVAFDEDYIIGTYQVRMETKNIEKLALAVADEQTTGTWIKVSHDSADKTKDFGAKVVAIYEVPDLGYDRGNEQLPPMHIVQIAFPMRNMGASLPMMLSTVFGNISASGMLKWIDVAFPKKYVAQFQGPKFGVEGLREKLGVYDRPLLNAMIKPNIGWNNTPEDGQVTHLRNPDFKLVNYVYVYPRLFKNNPQDFAARLKQRYIELRQGVLHTDSLVNRYVSTIDTLQWAGAAAREEARWSGNSDISGLPLNFEAEKAYIEQWLRARLAYLDLNKFYYPPAMADLSGDGIVDVRDVDCIIDIVLGRQQPTRQADINSDGQVDVQDVNIIIDIILGKY